MMMAVTIKISSKGQVVIPKEVRDALHWETGVELVLVATENGVVLQTKVSGQKQPVKSLRGFLQHTGSTVPTEQLCQPVEYSNDRF